MKKWRDGNFGSISTDYMISGFQMTNPETIINLPEESSLMKLRNKKMRNYISLSRLITQLIDMCIITFSLIPMITLLPQKSEEEEEEGGK